MGMNGTPGNKPNWPAELFATQGQQMMGGTALTVEIGMLREEIAALRAELRQPKSIFITGREAERIYLALKGGAA